MGCCGQNPVGSGAVAVDTCKRVNYTLGMLLGVDDFVQESAYHSARRRQLARAMLGYGTLNGLAVVVEVDGDKGPRLRVTPGVAWLPSGTPVCVDAEQCCNLNDWLAARATLVSQALAADSPPANIVLHVVLSYAPCLTDNVAIPGEPCRSEDELMQPSRVADGFTLELRLAAPPQREEDAIRDFVDWLTNIPVVTGSPPIDEQHFIAQLRDAAHAWLQPSSPPMLPDDFMFGAPAGGLRADEALLRAALRLWTTELRPLWMARSGCGCGAQQPAGVDDAVLLATLDVPVVDTGGGSGWRVSSASEDQVTIDESWRPVLLSLRMVQELITQNPTPEAADSVVAANTFGLLPAAGIDPAYSRADHSHGTPTLPNLGGDLSGAIGAASVDKLQNVPLAATGAVNGQGLLFNGTGWAPADVVTELPTLGGDVTGAIGETTVAGLQGRSMSAAAPASGDALLFTGTAWAPGRATAVIPPFGGDLSGAIGTETLVRLQGQPVEAKDPAPDDVLRFVDGNWVPAPLPTTTGDFVGRTAGPYEIVAAGEIQLDFSNMELSVDSAEQSSYGSLKLDNGRVMDNFHAHIGFTATVPGTEELAPRYVVKLTPIWLLDSSKTEFKLYLLDSVMSDGDVIGFTVRLSADSQIVDGEFSFRFHVEVSRFFERVLK